MSAKGCRCLDQIEKQLKQKYGDSVELQTVALIDLKTGRPTRRVVPPLDYTFRRTPKGRRIRGYVRAMYCQFCGESQ